MNWAEIKDGYGFQEVPKIINACCQICGDTRCKLYTTESLIHDNTANKVRILHEKIRLNSWCRVCAEHHFGD